MIKIITWNVNGYRAITGQNAQKRYDKITNDNKFFAYIEKEKPEIIAIQEVKADYEQINEELRSPEGYEGYYHTCSAKKGYSGVAIFSKIKPKHINKKMNIDSFDSEGRFLELDFEDFIFFGIYFPKGYEDKPERLKYKLDFYDALYNYLKPLLKKGRNILVSGDYNTAHNEIDLARPKENIGTSGFMPIEREKLDEFVKMGFIDTFREFNKEPGNYTWWSQRGSARANNVGWRIDYQFADKKLMKNIIGASQQPETQGSDHCPVLVELDL